MKKILIIIFLFLACEKEEIKTVKEMAKQTINIGSAYGDPDATPRRDAFDMCNDNFTELYVDVVQNTADIDELEALNPNSLPTVVVQITSWDMDTNATKNIAYDPPANKAVININVTIFNDATTKSYPIENGGSVLWYNNNFELTRDGAGVFDGTDFNSGSANRGYIIFSLITVAI